MVVVDVKRLSKCAGLIALAAFLAAAGCGGRSPRPTSLKLVADNGMGRRAVFRLRCDPSGGDIAHPARACTALKGHLDVLFHPKPFLCHFESWKLSIKGRFDGRPISVRTDTCWTPQMELIDLLGIANQLQAHIVPFPVRRDLFAKVAEIRPGTPSWMIPVAQAEARLLHDPQPARMRIGLGLDNLVELWGHFHCQNWRITKNRRPPHQVRTGVYARFTIDRETHVVTSLWIGPEPTGTTDLRLVAANEHVGKAVFRLLCNPPGGNIEGAAKVCVAIAKNPEVVLHPQPFVCRGGFRSHWNIALEGRFQGRRLNEKTETCWTAQMDLIRVLGIKNQLKEHLVTHAAKTGPGALVPGALAVTTDIPSRTRVWLLRLAQRETTGLQDPWPDRMTIRLGRIDVIGLHGRFVCEMCSRPPGAQAPSGTYARLTVDPERRSVISFSLNKSKS
jgi:hypothetical protein